MVRVGMLLLAIFSAGSAGAFTPSLSILTSCEASDTRYAPNGFTVISSVSEACRSQSLSASALARNLSAGIADIGPEKVWSIESGTPTFGYAGVPNPLIYDASAGYTVRSARGNLGAVTTARALFPQTSQLGFAGGNASVKLESWDEIVVRSEGAPLYSPIQLRFTGHIETSYEFRTNRDPTLAYGPSRDDQVWFEFYSEISIGQTNAFFRPLTGTSLCVKNYMPLPQPGCVDVDLDFDQGMGQFDSSAKSGTSRKDHDLFLDWYTDIPLQIYQNLISFSAAGYATQNYEPMYSGDMTSASNAWNSSTLYVETTSPGFRIEAASGHDYAPAVVIPEPSTLALAGFGLFFVAVAGRFRR